MERKSYIDVAKGIAMLLVVMQHTGGMLDPGIRLLCKVDVPLFFLVSGYLAYKPYIDIKKQFVKLIKRVFIPFVLACLFAALYFQDNVLDIFISSGKRGYWFLEALFLMKLLFWIIYKNKRILITGGLIIEACLLILSKYGSDTLDGILCISYMSRYFPCLLAGAIIKMTNYHALSNKWYGAMLSIIAFVGLGIYFKSTNISFIAHVLGYAAAAVLAFMVIKRYTDSLPKWIHKSFSYIGIYSLNIYIIHWYFVSYVNFNLGGIFIYDFTVTLAIALIVVALSIVTGKILTYCTPLGLILTK